MGNVIASHSVGIGIGDLFGNAEVSPGRDQFVHSTDMYWN